MPELPEVETIARRLRAVLIHKSITIIDVLRKKSFVGESERLIGAQITGIERRSKIISVAFSNGLYLLIHLKMTGQLIFVEGSERIGGGHPTADFIESLPSKHTRAIITFTDETKLFFNDMRVFGWMKIVDQSGLDREYRDLAPDIISAEITSTYLLQKLSKRSQPIKQVIMDNSVVAGVGNIYASDALHLAKIDPRKKASTLSRAEVKRLLAAMKNVIELGIINGGATIHDYKNVDGLTGHYQDIRRVYAREDEACRVCSSIIVRIKQGGRSTFYCPHCQHSKHL
jgi:formamidopyrimidine-DNA glycosylase